MAPQPKRQREPSQIVQEGFEQGVAPPRRGSAGGPDYRFPGGYCGRVTPDPIPNSVVKPSSADGTAGGTLWESRSSPGLWPPPVGGGLLFWFGAEVAWYVVRAQLSSVHIARSSWPGLSSGRAQGSSVFLLGLSLARLVVFAARVELGARRGLGSSVLLARVEVDGGWLSSLSSPLGLSLARLVVFAARVEFGGRASFFFARVEQGLLVWLLRSGRVR